MGRIYKRGAFWWAYYCPQTGDYRRESLHTQDREVAKVRLQRLELGLPLVEPTPDPAKDQGPRLHLALDGYLNTIANEDTHDSYEQKSRHLERIFGENRALASISSEDMEAYVQTRRTEGAHPSTIYKELVVLRGVLKRAKLPIDIVPKVKQEYVPKDTWLSMDQLAALIKVLPRNRQTWVALAGYGGLCLSEVEAIKPEHVRIGLNGNSLKIPGTKADSRDRFLPIPEPLHQYLYPLMERLPVEHWPNVRRDLEVACKKAGVPKVTPNDLRRSFCSKLVQEGIPLFTAAKLMGHSGTRMVEKVYGHLAPNTYIAAIEQAFANVSSQSSVNVPAPTPTVTPEPPETPVAPKRKRPPTPRPNFKQGAKLPTSRVARTGGVQGLRSELSLADTSDAIPKPPKPRDIR